MPKACPQCGFQMPDVAAFCPGCGLRMIVPRMAAQRMAGPETTVPSATPASTTSSAKAHILGALAYVTFIPAIVFLVMEPFKRDRFVRFHSFQSIFLALAGVAIGIVIRVVFFLLSLVPWLGHLLAWLAVLVFCIGWVILWMVLVIKALQGEFFKLPGIGRLAERA